MHLLSIMNFGVASPIQTRAKSILPRPELSNVYNKKIILPRLTTMENTNLFESMNNMESGINKDLIEFYGGSLDQDWILNTDRIYLALESGLENERVWAYEILLEYSFSCPWDYNLESQKVFKYLEQGIINGYQHFEKVIKDNKGKLIDQEMVLIALILRNFSFAPNDASFILQNEPIRKIINYFLSFEKELSPFIDTTSLLELKSYFIDLFENASQYIQVQEDEFNNLFNMLISYDRYLIISSLRCTASLLLGNNSTLPNFNNCKKYVKRSIELLNIEYDHELLLVNLEFLSLYSYFLLDEFTNVILSLNSNFVRTTLNLLIARLSMEKKEESNTLYDLKRFQKWLELNFQSNERSSIAVAELYGEFCTLTNINMMQFMIQNGTRLTKIIVSQFPKVKINHFKKGNKYILYFDGIGRKQKEESISTIIPINNTMPANREIKPMIGKTSTRHYICKWSNCTKMLLNKADVLSHFRHEHAPQGQNNYFCNWDHCKSYPNGQPNRSILVEHFKEHLIQLAPSYELSEEGYKNFMALQDKNEVDERTIVKEKQVHEVIHNEPSIDECIVQLLVNLLKKMASSNQLHILFSSCKETLLQVTMYNSRIGNELTPLLCMLI